MNSDRSSVRADELRAGPRSGVADSRIFGNDSPAKPTLRRRRKYVTQAEADSVRRRLSERDLAVIATIARLRLVTGAQVRRLHITDGTQLSNARAARAMLARLTELRVLARLDRRIGGVRSGSDGFVYALDVLGQRLSGDRGPAGGRVTRRPWTPSYPFTDHILDVSELFVRLVEATRLGGLELLEFTAEPGCWRSYIASGGTHAILKPDAYVRTATANFELSWFVEVDRATESPSTLLHKCAAYRAHWASGREQHLHGIYPKVLWLVPDESRLAVLLDVLEHQPTESWRLFQVVLYQQAPSVLGGGRP